MKNHSSPSRFISLPIPNSIAQSELPPDVPFFPQMKPEKSAQEYIDLGIPEEWVEPLQALGYDSVDKIKEVEKPGKLHQEMMGYRKKNKLEIGTVTVEQVASWLVR
jgi:lysyl-tRNA synthetase class 2